MATVCFDLDDTLYQEMDFVRSGYRAVASYLRQSTGCDAQTEQTLYNLICAHRPSGFEAALDHLSGRGFKALPGVDDLIEVYRGHSPDISLFPGANEALASLQASGHRLVLITDGSTRHQRSKIAALGLERFFAPADILISEETHGDKTTEVPWQTIDGLGTERTDRYPAPFYYVGDNLMKDFYLPARRGWTTIMKRDVESGNVFRQDPSAWDSEHLAHVAIDNFSTLTKLIH